jgi:hypothetical protein
MLAKKPLKIGIAITYDNPIEEDERNKRETNTE